MTWFAFHGYNSGKAVDIAGTQEKEAVTLGFHGYGTESQAEANPNSVNVLNSWFVNGIIADAQFAVKAGEQPGGPNANILNPVTAAKGTAQAAVNLTGVNAIGDFFNRLTSANTWIRLAKVVIGGTLLLIGIAHITGAGNAVATAARKVPVPIL